MPRTIDATFKSEKAKRENQPLYLYTLEDYDGAGSNLNFAEYDQDVTYKGITYVKFPITHEFVAENSQGQIDAVKVRVSNVTRLLQSYLEQYDFRGLKVIIRMVWANELSDPDAYMDDIYYVDNYTATQQVVEFSLTGKFDVLAVDIPGRKYSRNYCGWKFKSTECGYVGSFAICNKTKGQCKERNNYQRFGGFPSVPSRRIFLS